MATSAAVFSAETYESLCEIYLALWRQLENIAGDTKWLEIRSENIPAVQEQVRRTIESLGPHPSSVLYSDYQTAQRLVLSGPRVNTTEVASFREYLRDNGLRYAQLADAMLPDSSR